MEIWLFYALTRLYGLVAIAMSSHADGDSFETDHIGTLIVPRKSADVAHPQGLEHVCFALHDGCVVRCLPYHAPSFDRFRARQRLTRAACGP